MSPFPLDHSDWTQQNRHHALQPSEGVSHAEPQNSLYTAQAQSTDVVHPEMRLVNANSGHTIPGLGVRKKDHKAQRGHGFSYRPDPEQGRDITQEDEKEKNICDGG
ncbi:hypothetical protein DFP72DRAFT_846809 [Ephemerocybe angulata]|uniref:Uncharacterized protein n=1 Tax=Ephemerocybe angulata TaxID=980116 RepID=A0A8H6M9G4_9AGAR|nr:hypothetical protein DFP72DRAFT_846809 [Tulosesus angulatus]